MLLTISRIAVRRRLLARIDSLIAEMLALPLLSDEFAEKLAEFVGLEGEISDFSRSQINV